MKIGRKTLVFPPESLLTLLPDMWVLDLVPNHFFLGNREPTQSATRKQVLAEVRMKGFLGSRDCYLNLLATLEHESSKRMSPVVKRPPNMNDFIFAATEDYRNKETT